MKYFKIALTGGPCAGKSTMYELIKKYLREQGYKVLAVDETATQLIERDILPKDYYYIPEFQNIVYYYQKTQERCAYDALKFNQQNDICIILCDRGLLDNKAYLNSYHYFDDIIEKNNSSEIEDLDSYDLVIALTSLAVTKPNEYNITSNKTRFENIKEASELDAKTKMAWLGHRNLRIVDTNKSIPEVFNNIKDIIDELITYYINEDKEEYLISKIDTEKYNDNNSRNIKVKEITLIDRFNNFYTVYNRKYKNKETWMMSVNFGNPKIYPTTIIGDVLFSYERLSDIDINELNIYENNTPMTIRTENDGIYLQIPKTNNLILPDNIKIDGKTKVNRLIRKQLKNL